MPERPTGTAAPVLLYDGACGLCSASVRWILARDPHGPLRFAALAGAVGQWVRERHAHVAAADSLVWWEPGSDRALVRSDAALAVARYLGGPWRAALALAVLPRPLRDAAYDLIARHRHRLGSSVDSCAPPAPGSADRFLETWPEPADAKRP